MVKETVEVTKVIDDKVEIGFTRQAMCDRCQASSLCGKGREHILIDRCALALKIGDKINIEVNEKRSLLASLLTFLLPAFLFVIILIAFRGKGEVKSFFLALSVICIYYGFLKLYLIRHPKRFNV